MQTNLILNSQIRTQVGKGVSGLRKAGFLPGILYGHGVENINLSVPYGDFEKIYKAAGGSTLVRLNIKNLGERNVIIHEVDNNPLDEKFIHVDFYQVRMDEKIKATVTLVFVGESEAVKTSGGILVKNISEIEVEALPADLPREISVSIESLVAFEDNIKISDLKVSDKVKIMANPEEVVALIVPPRSEEEITKLEEAVEEKVEEVEKVEKEEKVEEMEEEKEEIAEAPVQK